MESKVPSSGSSSNPTQISNDMDFSSDDDVPLKSLVKKEKHTNNNAMDIDSSSDEDIPLSALKSKKKLVEEPDSDEDIPLSALSKRAVADSDSSSDEDIPLSALSTSKKRVKKQKKTPTKRLKLTKSSTTSKTKKSTKSKSTKATKATKKKAKPKSKKKLKDLKPSEMTKEQREKYEKKLEREKEKAAKEAEEASFVWKWWIEEEQPNYKPLPDGQQWRTLEHNGVVFPPEYEPHNIKMKYDGEYVDLTPAQEEVATFYAVMLETDYAKNPIFIKNFFKDFKKLLGSGHKIKKFVKCDFTPIYQWSLRRKEAKAAMTSEEKKKIRLEREAREKKYTFAIVDGHKQKVGNFHIEPPGLFRGRGEHPSMGRLKKRIKPEDVTLNIGKNAPIPECPVPGHKWGKIVNKNDVTWLACWTENIASSTKYVWLAPSSRTKQMADRDKFEKARKLAKIIDKVRKSYTKELKSKDLRKKQRATAIWVIDKLALRVGGEKDEDEADTVGCTSLRVEHITLVEPNIVKFDFLGKDYIRYERDVVVDNEQVFKNLGEFKKNKEDGQDLFDKLNASILNTYLNGIMPGLTGKVFRTYNASFTLEQELDKTPENRTVSDLLLYYNEANRKVAILCNHQRAVSKSHDASLQKKKNTLKDLKKKLKELNQNIKENKDKEKKKKILLKRRKTLKERITKQSNAISIQENNKNVALGTSKINYLDPRITTLWCDKHNVPVEKMFNKSLRAKFPWAYDMKPSWRFAEKVKSSSTEI